MRWGFESGFESGLGLNIKMPVKKSSKAILTKPAKNLNNEVAEVSSKKDAVFFKTERNRKVLIL